MVMTGGTGSTTTTTTPQGPGGSIFGATTGGGGTNTGLGNIDWNGPVSTATLAGATIPILGGAGDPNGLANLIPNVGPGHAPLTVGARIASIATISGAKRNQLGNLLASALGEKGKKNYTVSQVQSMLSTAFRQTGQSGATNLSDWVTQAKAQSASGAAAGTSSTGAKITIPTPTDTLTLYNAADLTATANAAAQKLLGRNARPDEIQSITDAVNAQEQANTQNRVTANEASVAANDQAANSGSQVDQFLAAIRTHESGGDYKANSGDGAYGAYQYIPTTWNSEARAAGYGQYANGRADQAPPAVQDAVARFNATNLYNGNGGSWEMAARAWYDPAYINQPNYAPPGNNGLTIGQYGKDIVGLMAAAAPTPPSSPNAGVNSPVGPGLKQGRTDQGVDWTGSGPLFAVDSGTILSTKNAGWPGGAFIALKLDHPIDPQHSVVYYAENINPGVKVGQKVKAGQQIGTATGANNARGSGIEIGWGDPNAIGSALAHGAGGEGAVTAEGTSFLNYISGGAGNQSLAAAAAAGGTPYLTALYKDTQTMQNAISQPGANNVTIDTQTAHDPTSIAENYFMNQHSSEYQTQNLLGVFSKINDTLKSGGAQATGAGGAPIDMRAQA